MTASLFLSHVVHHPGVRCDLGDLLSAVEATLLLLLGGGALNGAGIYLVQCVQILVRGGEVGMLFLRVVEL